MFLDHCVDVVGAGTTRAAQDARHGRGRALGVALAWLAAVLPAVAGWAAPGEWPRVEGDADGAYHSPLTDINQHTASRLGFAWEYRLGTHRGLEATPVVVDGVLYVSGNFGRVYALDAVTGQERWTYDPQIDGQWGRYACCDAVNRGVAYSRGRIYVAALDGYLHAIDAATGRRVWKVDTLPARGPKTPYTTTGAPVVAGDLLIIGAAGGDFAGVRGYVAAFDVGSGRLRWRFYTVPRNPALGAQDQPHLRAAVATWDRHHRWETGAGGTVWDGIAYDPKLHLVYVGTGNPSPYDIKEDGRSGGDNLYTDCILALHADTGALAWHFQTVPGDMWDFDSTQNLVLGQLGSRPVIMQASKNGFFYVLDRATGEFVSAKNFAFQNWTLGLDAHTGRPQLNPAVDYSATPKLVFPWEGGAHGWQPMSFDAGLQRAFIPVQEAENVLVETVHRKAGLVEGQFTSPAFLPEVYDPPGMQSLFGELPPLESLGKGDGPGRKRHGFLRAWDAATQRLVWEVPTAGGWDGGVLSTAGGVVLQGDVTGHLNVYSADTGALLKSVDLGSSVMAAPMSYAVGGVQYVAVLAGFGGGDMGYPFAEGSAARRYGNQGRLITLRLDGGPVPHLPELVAAPFPQPPPRTGSTAQIAHGEVLFNRYCGRCHVEGIGELPDLRRLTPEKHALFQSIVRGGALSGLGMGRFDDVLSKRDVDDIHAYVISESWSAVAAAAPAPTAAEGVPAGR